MLLNQILRRPEDVRSLLAIQFLLQTLQSQADNIAVVQPGTDLVFRGETKPEIVKAVDILRPQPGRVRPKVYVGRGAFWDNHFE